MTALRKLVELRPYVSPYLLLPKRSLKEVLELRSK